MRDAVRLNGFSQFVSDFDGVEIRTVTATVSLETPLNLLVNRRRISNHALSYVMRLTVALGLGASKSY